MPDNKNKKAERGFRAQARNTWTRKPITQVVSSDKVYNRKKEKQKLRQHNSQGDDGVFAA